MYISSDVYDWLICHRSYGRYFELGLRGIIDYSLLKHEEKLYLIGVNFNTGASYYRFIRQGSIIRDRKSLKFPIENLIRFTDMKHAREEEKTKYLTIETHGIFTNKALVLSDNYDWKLTTAKLKYKDKVLGV